MSLHGLGDVVQIQGRFTAAKYVEILEEVFLPSLRERDFPFPGQILFVQDKCPVHTARILQVWFQEHPQLELVDWPSRGCDMNPIEDMWANMVNTWEPEEERTPPRLMEHVNTVWGNLRGKPLAYNSVASMQRRLQAVIDHEGGWSKY